MTVSATRGTLSATVTALTAARALAALRDRGHDWAMEARRAGLPPTLEPEFSWRVPVAAIEALFERGAALCGPDFVLQAAPSRPEDNRSPVGLYCRTRSDVRAALEAATVLYAHVTDAYRLALEETPAGARLRWCGPALRGLFWFDAADALRTLRSVFPTAALEAITTPFGGPPGARAFFGCPIRPDEAFALHVPRALLSRPLPPTDPALRALVERQVAALTVPRATSAGLVAALRALGPTATVGALAEALGTSERTLHRRFGDAGTSFRAELDALRAELARDMPGRTAEEVAELLGYSDVRAYRRAMRRWERPAG